MSTAWFPLILVLLGWAVPPAQDPALTALAQQADELRSALAAARTTADQVHAELVQEQARLADEVVALELERLTLQAELESARSAADYASDQADVDQARQVSARAALSQLAEQVHLYANELPGESAHVPDFSGELAPALSELAALVDTLDARAQTVGRRQVTLRTASGTRTDVELLNVGHVGFAYRELDGETLGLAFAAPRHAEGFRWRTELPDTWAAASRALFDDTAAGDFLEAPLDVTGTLRSDTDLATPTLRTRFAAGGPVMWPLALLAGLCTLLLTERGIALYVRDRPELRLGAKVVTALASNDLHRVQQLVAHERSSVARTVAAVLRFRGAPRAVLEDRLQEAVLLQLPRLRRSLRTIAVLAAIAPLLGLLGTITGIIDTFGVLRATGSNDPSLMAGGISEALFTTAAGLVIAIPVLLLHGLLRGRVEAIVAASEGQAVLVLNALTAERSDVYN